MGKISEKLVEKGRALGLSPKPSESSQSFSHRIREAQKSAAGAVQLVSRKAHWRRR